MPEKHKLGGMGLAVLCLLAFIVSPSVILAQVPVFKINQADSSIKFNVKALRP
jgi:hypothetical protein